MLGQDSMDDLERKKAEIWMEALYATLYNLLEEFRL